MEVDRESVDREFMLRAIALGERGRLRAPPNPWVGCLLVGDGTIIGEGYHNADGEPHAEVVALQQAGSKARGATAYVSLEPCAHHGRTPPCACALVTAGVARVVIAIEDPDLRVSEKGIARLRQAGVEVVVGVCRAEATRSLRSYLHQRRTGSAYCILKAAVSLDGRLAAADGTSQWISSPEARVDVHRLRAESQAVLVGAGTAIADQPYLTVRDWMAPDVRQPLRVLLDASGRVPAEGPLFDPELAPTLVVTTFAAPEERIREWKRRGADVQVVPQVVSQDSVGVDLAATLRLLGKRGVLQVLVEGGSQVHSSLLREGLGDQLTLYFGALLLGDRGLPLSHGVNPSSISAAKRLVCVHSAQFGDTLRADYLLQ